MNLMTIMAGVDADDKNCIIACTDTADCIVTMGYCKFKSFCKIVKLPMRYAYTPCKIVNIGNVLLVGLR